MSVRSSGSSLSPSGGRVLLDFPLAQSHRPGFRGRSFSQRPLEGPWGDRKRNGSGKSEKSHSQALLAVVAQMQETCGHSVPPLPPPLATGTQAPEGGVEAPHSILHEHWAETLCPTPSISYQCCACPLGAGTGPPGSGEPGSKQLGPGLARALQPTVHSVPLSHSEEDPYQPSH